jgi:hypothetical protein
MKLLNRQLFLILILCVASTSGFAKNPAERTTYSQKLAAIDKSFNMATAIFEATRIPSFELVLTQTVALNIFLNANSLNNLPDLLQPALLHACKIGNEEIVAYLLSMGANPNFSFAGESPWSVAQQNGHAHITALLQSLGFNFSNVVECFTPEIADGLLAMAPTATLAVPQTPIQALHSHSAAPGAALDPAPGSNDSY